MTNNTPTRRRFVRSTAAAATFLGISRVPTALAAASAARSKDGTRLYYEVRGMGPPIVFLHEVPGSCRSFDTQVAALEGQFQCIAYNARGYPPSDVPPSIESYSEDISATDVGAILDAAGLRDAHLVGVSMGSSSALQFALRYPSRVRSLILCSIGTGSDLGPGEYAANVEAAAQKVEASDQRTISETLGKFRQHIHAKNPGAFRNFLENASTLSPLGIANTLRGNQKHRAPIYAHKDRLAGIATPTLIVVGQDDPPCVKPSHFLADTIPSARLETVPEAGHSINLEYPATINRLLREFVSATESGRAFR